MKKLIAVIFGVLVFSGCAPISYMGVPEGTPSEEYARIVTAPSIIRPPIIGMLYSIGMVCVDGEVFRYSTGEVSRISEAVVSKGVHHVKLRLDRGGSAMPIAYTTLWLDAQPGHTYVAKFEVSRRQFRIWFEDEDSGEQVGGLIGSEPYIVADEKRCV
ncbi:hypothetical protein [Franzmannia qiaohouensis]|uniref:Uncharacterized protein n=1 Tax=Franzmannia qiaohouensis TaxID=1329370 RepID=A0ABU1HK47_9GAMM|nr:hypothetical protein [Halomonas qiaohouensis]MDR5906960.1 hypothetical protein [Halomonas qiaohouensis]